MLRYLEERQELLRAAVPGVTSARRLARLTDEMLIEVAEGPAAAALPRGTGWCLLALGGYGAGQLLPESDLDLLVVSRASPTALKPFVERLVYPLWDAGLSVGHQVRSKRDQLAATRQDLTVLTATLTGRVLAGDAALGRRVLQTCAGDAAKRASAILPALAQRARPGSPYLLEPDLKNGAGGRRDYDELTWTAAVLAGAPQSDPAALVSLGLMEAEELTRLERAADTVAAARWELQLAGSSSLMSEEAALDMSTRPHDVQGALADTHHLLLRARSRMSGMGTAGGAPLSPQAVFDLIERGHAAGSELEEAAWAGRLDHLVTGMSALMTLRRPGIAHTLTVGAHSIACALESADILAGRIYAPAEDPFLAASAHRVEDGRTVWVAALVHDVGKTEPGPGHAERGADPAYLAAQRFGLEEEARHVAELVRHHLDLAVGASSADLDDPASVTEIARALGDGRLVAPLHVLTAADSRSTGPSAWTAWHATLVGTLVSRLDASLAQGAEDQAMSLALDPEQIAALVARVNADPTPGAHVLEIGAGPLSGTFRVTVAARDRTGLLASIAGALALSGLDILSAHSAPTPRGVAVDSFVVASATLAPVATENWTRLERQLSAALSGRLALAVRLAERRRHYTPRVSGSLTADIDEEPHGAVLRVRVPDRIGLLHDIARAVTDSGLSVRSLTATSRAGWAEDTFRLRYDPGSGAGALGQLAMRLREL